MAIETTLTESPGAVAVELGQFQLMPGPKGEQGERGPRGYGIESAVLNEDFTLTLKFEDGSSYTTSSLRGEQGSKGEPGERGPVGPAGPGGGDMVESTYDPQGKSTDIFRYADDAAANAVKDVQAGNVRFADGQTFQEKLEAGDLKGDRGEAGPAGPAGPQGAEGEDGKDGDPGPAGKDGATWKPSVDGDTGLLSWTQDSSGDAPESVSIKGPKGDDGKDGAPGEQGAPGEPGAPGKDGAAAGFGTPTAEVDDSTGTPTVEVTASGENTEKVFHFKFTGLKGETGPAGAVGPAGPAGANGKDGAPGQTGPQGPEGPNRVSAATATDIKGLLKGNGSTVEPAQAGTDYVAPPKKLTVTLTNAGWNGDTEQTVTAQGVSADEEAQEIHVMPASKDIKAYMDAGVYCSGQGENELSFTCDAAPEADITVYVTVWELPKGAGG